jgi:hypothetical protein
MLLTKDEIEEVYIELREGTPMKSIAKMFDVSVTCLQDFNKGRYYKVPGMRYPIVDRQKKYGKEPYHGSSFYDMYEPEPMLYWPPRRENYE